MKKKSKILLTIALLIAACSKNKTVDSPIMGEYEFGFSSPEKVIVGDLRFNYDGTVDGIKLDNGVLEK